MHGFVLVGSIGHIIAGFLFTGLGVWSILQPGSGMQRRGLGLAAIITGIWCVCVANKGDTALLPFTLESLRNLAWLGFMLLLSLRGRRESWHPAIVALYGVLAAVIFAEVVLNLVSGSIVFDVRVAEAVSFVSLVLRMMVAVGALVLVHNLYTAAAREVRWGIAPSMIALAVMWIYDLNLYTVAYLTSSPVTVLYAFRGPLMVVLGGLIALGSRRNLLWKMRLSRTVTFQTLSLIAIGGYLLGMVLIVRALDLAGFRDLQIAQLAVVIGMSVLALVLLPSQRLRAWLRIKLIKHFFQHRYDYRAEWLRFTETLGRPGNDAALLDERVVKAIADITESPGGILLVPDDNDGLMLGARWCWPTLDVPSKAADLALMDHCRTTGRIIEFDAIRQGKENYPGEAEVLPAWMIENGRVWAAVPLIHFDRLVGIALLERPFVDRMLDWEDFDLLRLTGRQVASYLAEARGQEELSDAKRFDEFNRRFAFIMHDIKNLVSQLALVARNAERHADNPEFRADMVATLKSSVDKMNDLLARLSQHNRGRIEDPRAVSLRAVANTVAAGKRHSHDVIVEAGPELEALADPVRLEQALGHLVQNAIDATADEAPIMIGVEQRGEDVVLSVKDRGKGMSADFIRNQLFRPFASTKGSGFGIGAFEARALVSAMGGRVEVSSREGAGSRFDIILRSVPAFDMRVAS